MQISKDLKYQIHLKTENIRYTSDMLRIAYFTFVIFDVKKIKQVLIADPAKSHGPVSENYVFRRRYG